MIDLSDSLRGSGPSTMPYVAPPATPYSPADAEIFFFLDVGSVVFLRWLGLSDQNTRGPSAMVVSHLHWVLGLPLG